MFLCFLDLFLFDDNETVEIVGKLLPTEVIVAVLLGVLMDGIFGRIVVDVDGIEFVVNVSGTLDIGGMALSISVTHKKKILVYIF